MSEANYKLVIDGREIEAAPDSTIIQAYARAGQALTANVGCMGQGGGSCRCMVRREGEREVTTALACETRVEPGMQVALSIILFPNTSIIMT